MTIQEQVKKDMINAMKNKETDKVSLLKVLMGEFSRVGKELTDEQAIKQIRSMFENAKQMNNQFEVDILNKYLPQMLDEEETRKIVLGIIETQNCSSMKDMGKVMGGLKKHSKSTQIDNKLASNIVKDILK
jgi:hypothetical protein